MDSLSTRSYNVVDTFGDRHVARYENSQNLDRCHPLHSAGGLHILITHHGQLLILWLDHVVLYIK